MTIKKQSTFFAYASNCSILPERIVRISYIYVQEACKHCCFFAGLKNNAKKDLRRTLALRYRISVAYES